MDKIEELREKISGVVDGNRMTVCPICGYDLLPSMFSPNEVADQILQACKDAGLRFVDMSKGYTDYLVIEEIEL